MIHIKRQEELFADKDFSVCRVKINAIPEAERKPKANSTCHRQKREFLQRFDNRNAEIHKDTILSISRPLNRKAIVFAARRVIVSIYLLH